MIVSALSVYPAAADLPTGATIGCTLRLVLLLLALMRVLLPRRERTAGSSLDVLASVPHQSLRIARRIFCQWCQALCHLQI
jgi:hypothetical protein